MHDRTPEQIGRISEQAWNLFLSGRVTFAEVINGSLFRKIGDNTRDLEPGAYLIVNSERWPFTTAGPELEIQSPYVLAWPCHCGWGCVTPFIRDSTGVKVLPPVLFEPQWIEGSKLLRIDSGPIEVCCAIVSQAFIGRIRDIPRFFRNYADVLIFESHWRSLLRKFGLFLFCRDIASSIQWVRTCIRLNRGGKILSVDEELAIIRDRLGIELEGSFLARLNSVPASDFRASPSEFFRRLERDLRNRFKVQIRRQVKNRSEDVVQRGWARSFIGGWPGMGFERSIPTRNFPVKGELKSERELQDCGLWWWRDICSWRADVVAIFKDNWETSALFYELRARLNNPRRWDLFGTPWVDLGICERGLLAEIWPPSHDGSWRFREMSEEENDAEDPTELFTVRLWMSDEEIMEEIKAAKKRYRSGRYPPANRPQREGQTPPDLSHYWRMLEAMDIQFYFDIHMGTTPRKNKSRILKRYHAACSRFDLNPGPVDVS